MWNISDNGEIELDLDYSEYSFVEIAICNTKQSFLGKGMHRMRTKRLHIAKGDKNMPSWIHGVLPMV